MMARNLQQGKGISRPRAKSSGLCNHCRQVQVDDGSCVLGCLEDCESGTMQMSENHGFFSPIFPFTSNQASMDDLSHTAVWATGANDEVWPPIDVPSSLPEFLTSGGSDTYDTRDDDPTEQSLLLTSSNTLSDEYYAQDYEPYDWDSSVESNLIMPRGYRGNQRLDTLSHSDMRTETPSLTITHKRKRSVNISVPMKDDRNFIDKKDALKLFAEIMPNPSVYDVGRLAEGFDVQDSFVLDLCLQERAKREYGSAHLRTTKSHVESASMFTEPVTFVVPAKKKPAVIKGLDKATLSVDPGDLPRSSIESPDVATQESGGHCSQCPKCGAVMSRSADLPRHLKTHLPKQLRCPYPGCRKRFNRKDKLDDHFRRMHRDLVSKADVLRDRKEDIESDPDYGSSGESGSLRPEKRLQGVQGKVSSMGSKRQSCGSSSCHGVKDFAMCSEIFYPVSQNVSASEFVRKYDSARVIRKLGQGGFGRVYEFAIPTGANGSGEVFACKIISLPNLGSDDAIKRARNEIRILQALDHAHIVNFVGAFISTGKIMINTRPVANCNLREYLSRQSSPLSKVAESQLWDAVRGLASALSYLHGQGGGGGFHGDIKPENILVIQDPEIKSWTRFLLADFGSARLPTSALEIIDSIQAATPRYCAPECFKNIKERGPPSDIWSFGCILTQIITYLHDRTMAEFETFRAHNTESQRDWTYNEILPAVIGWLRFLSGNGDELIGSAITSGYLDLVTDMLSPIPRERPSAIEVVARLDMYKNLLIAKRDQMQNYGMELRRLQAHQSEPAKFYRTINRIPERRENEGICKRSDEWPGVSLIPGNSTLGKPIPMEHATDSPAQASQKLLEIDFVGMANLASLISSSFIIYTPEIYITGKSINYSLDSVTDYDLKARQHHETEVTRSESAKVQLLRASPPQSSIIDSSIYNVNNQPTLAYVQQHATHFQLKLVPKCQQSCEQPSGEPGSLRYISSKGYSSPYASEQRSSRRPNRCRRRFIFQSSNKGTVNKRACSNRQMTGSRRCSFISNQCRELIPHPSKTTLNYRCSLGDYNAYFFPKMFAARFEVSAIRELIRRNTVGFTGNRMTVFVSVGPHYPPMKLTVYEFVPSDRDSLRLCTITGASATKFQSLPASYALPLGVADVGSLTMSSTCLRYIELMVGEKHSLRQLHGDEASIISTKVWEAVNSYRQFTSRNGGNTALLQKACMLYAMHCFMGRVMSFTKMSAQTAASRLQAPVMVQLNEGPTLTSRVLNVQVKKVMYDLLCKMSSQVLDGLQNRLSKRRNQSTWAESFSVWLILCNCIEETQTHLDALAFFQFFRDPTQQYDTMHTLEGELFVQTTNLFHWVYRTTESFNPLQHGLLVDETNGITQNMVDFVQEIRQLMNQHGKYPLGMGERLLIFEGNEMEEKARDVRREFRPDFLTCPMAFRKRNSGRLVSKFLKSFT